MKASAFNQWCSYFNSYHPFSPTSELKCLPCLFVSWHVLNDFVISAENCQDSGILFLIKVYKFQCIMNEQWNVTFKITTRTFIHSFLYLLFSVCQVFLPQDKKNQVTEPSFSSCPGSLSFLLGFCTAGASTADSFFKYKIILFYMCECLSACMSGTMCISGVHGGQKKLLDSLELELQLESTIWMLRTEPRSSLRAASALNHWAISLVPVSQILGFFVCLFVLVFRDRCFTDS